MNANVPEVWVSTVTNRGKSYLQNIAHNFLRQSYPLKRLCVVLNSNLDQKEVQDFFFKKNIQHAMVISMPHATLGECLNCTVKIMMSSPKGFIWAKMDDDDYYGENYLLINVHTMLSKKADIVGRRDMYVYIPEWKRMYFLNNGGHNHWVTWVQGASLTVSKKVFRKIQFPSLNKGEDTYFGKKATALGFRTYAAPVLGYVVVRHENNNHHTWKVNLHKFLKSSVLVQSQKTKEFEKENHIFFN